MLSKKGICLLLKNTLERAKNEHSKALELVKKLKEEGKEPRGLDYFNEIAILWNNEANSIAMTKPILLCLHKQ